MATDTDSGSTVTGILRDAWDFLRNPKALLRNAEPWIRLAGAGLLGASQAGDPAGARYVGDSVAAGFDALHAQRQRAKNLAEVSAALGVPVSALETMGASALPKL